MSNLSVGFIRGSIIWLLVGIGLGLIMAFPDGFGWLTAIGLGQPSLAHAHALLPGFLLMMLMGVGYHIFPRFTGNPLRWPWLGQANLWCSWVGTTGQVLGFFCRGLVPWLLPVGASIQTVGLICFAINVWQVVRPLKPLKPM
ncbi:MAG TPA: hypothetical protein VGK74_04160 [Symbiobacteriaceae bacterium]|jgi:hypothetical protein